MLQPFAPYSWETPLMQWLLEELATFEPAMRSVSQLNQTVVGWNPLCVAPAVTDRDGCTDRHS